MFDSAFERLLSVRLARAYDCWNSIRSLRIGARHGIWYVDATAFGEPVPVEEPNAQREATPSRAARLDALAAQGILTATELSTLRRLLDGMSFAEIAAQDGCSRQAVVARLVGNSKKQGGVLRKCRAAAPTSPDASS